ALPTGSGRPPAPDPTGPNRALLRIDLRDLVALQAEPGHQALLAENERVDIVLHRRARRGLGLTFVHHGDARTDADLEALCLVELGYRGVVHEEHRVAILLRSGLQPRRH